MPIKCPHCAHSNPSDAEFCEQCGAQLPASAMAGAAPTNANSNMSYLQALGLGGPAPTSSSSANQLVCPNKDCQAPLAEGDEFCFNCGTDVRKLTGAAPAPAAYTPPAYSATPYGQPSSYGSQPAYDPFGGSPTSNQPPMTSNQPPMGQPPMTSNQPPMTSNQPPMGQPPMTSNQPPANSTAGSTVATPPTSGGGMSDDEINKALSGIGSSGSNFGSPVAPPANATPPVNATGPEAQPAVMPPYQTPNPTVANTSGGSMPMPPGASGGVAGNAFGVATANPTPAWAGGSPTVSNPPTPAATGATILRLHVAGPYGDETVEWRGIEILLGRKDSKTRVFPDVNLDDSASSRRHLAIWKEPNDNLYYAQDLESANGTSLNGREMRSGEPTLINNGDVLKIGTRYSIQVKIS